VSHAMNSLTVDEDERRAHGRIDRIHKLFMQVVEGDQRPSGPLLRCTCENVSSKGLGVTLVEPLVAGAQVEIWINIEDANLRFLLGGVVRWCRPAVHRCLHEVGVELTRGAGDEFEHWAEMWSEAHQRRFRGERENASPV